MTDVLFREVSIIYLLILTSVDVFVCGTNYGFAGKKINLLTILLMSGVSALMFCIALLIGNSFLSNLDVNLAKAAGRIIFIVLGVWIIVSSYYVQLEKHLNIGNLVETVLLSFAMSIDAFIVGLALSASSFDFIWVLYLFLIGVLFFVLGQALGAFCGVSEIEAMPIFRGLFFILWGLFA